MCSKMLAMLLFVCVLLGQVTEISAVKSRSDDVNPLTAVVEHQAQLLTQLQARVESLEAWKAKQQQTVAFNARLSASVNVTGRHIVKFNHVDINVGNGYSALTGVFTAPVSGLYEFSVKISHQPPGKLHVQVFKQGNLVAEVEAHDDDNRDRASADVVLHLSQGQRVWAARGDGSTSGFSGSHGFGSTFMGILIQAD